MIPNKTLNNFIEISHYWCSRLGYTWGKGEMYDRDWRFYTNFEKGAVLIFNDVKYELQPGYFYLIPPLTPMTSQVESGHNPRQFFIHFKTGYPHNRVARGIYQFPLTSDIEKKISRLMNDIEETNFQGSVKGILICLSLIAATLIELPKESFTDEVRDSRIMEIIYLIEKDLSQNIPLEELSSRVGLSKNSLIQLFKKQVGCTPYRFITRKRVDLALLLMTDKSLSIEEISEKCGYCDRFQFSRIFKNLMNISPGEYRKKSHA